MERTIRVTGKGLLKLKPDTTTIRMNITGLKPTYEKAVAEAAEKTRKLAKALRPAGFNPEDIKTGDYSINAEHRYEDNVSVFKGFRYNVSSTISFPVSNETLGMVLGCLADSKTNTEFYIDFSVQDTEKAKEQLLEKAVMDAKRKAEILCLASGVKLEEIINIDYSFGEISFISGGRYELNCMADTMMAKSRSIDVDIEPDDISVSDTVTVVWSIH